MKKLIVLFLSLLMLFSLCGCSEYVQAIERGYKKGLEKSEEGFKNNLSCRFVKIHSSSGNFSSGSMNTVFYVDSFTGVVYFELHSTQHKTMSVLLNSDGTPITYEQFEEQLKEFKDGELLLYEVGELK